VGLSFRDRRKAQLEKRRRALHVLETTQYGDFEPAQDKYLNLTGFGQKDNYYWDILDNVTDRFDKVQKDALPPGGLKDVWAPGRELKDKVFYRNISGVLAGPWIRSQVDKSLSTAHQQKQLNLTELSPDTNWAHGAWERNITGKEGRMKLRLEEEQQELAEWEGFLVLPDGEPEGQVRETSATLTIYDESNSGEGWEISLYGVHFPTSGNLVMTTKSAKYDGLYGLPHVMANAAEFSSARYYIFNLLNEKLSRENSKATSSDLSPSERAAESLISTPRCEYLVYLQSHPLQWAPDQRHDVLATNVPGHLLDLERELRNPTGLPITEIPNLRMSAVIFSPDCGFILESKGPPDFAPGDGVHLQGLKQEIFTGKVKRLLLIFTTIVVSQIGLLNLQMKEASTPSTLSRISLYTVGIMVMADALLFFCFSLLGAVVPNFFPAAHLLSFGGLLSLAIGGKFLNELWNVQEPERRDRERNHAPAAASNTVPAVNAIEANSLPTSASRTSRIEAPVFVPFDQDIDADIAETATGPLLPTANQPQAQITSPPTGFGTVYTRIVLGITIIFFISVHSLTWRSVFQTAYQDVMILGYLSLWIPQIYRNAVRNCRKALLWKFVVGQSVLRLLPLTYLYLYEDNIFFAKSDWKTWTVFVGWVWLQTWVLVAQYAIGPRYGLPQHWMPDAWDYHPLLREDAEADGLPIGLIKTSDSPTSASAEEVSRQEIVGNQTMTVDCAICMQTLEVPVIPSGGSVDGGGVTGALARRLYMVTPCRHIFHTACLEGWMRLRLQCPIDRETLPPL
jgi:hypothetical protein